MSIEPLVREAEARRSALAWDQVIALATIVVAAWVTFSPSWFLQYPLGVRGRDTGIWQSAPGLVVLLLAVARYRAPLHSWKSALGLLVLSPALGALPFLLGYGPSGEFAVAWWNLVVSSAFLTVLAVAGLVHIVRRA